MNNDSIININSFDILNVNKKNIFTKTIYYNDYIISIIKKTDN